MQPTEDTQVLTQVRHFLKAVSNKVHPKRHRCTLDLPETQYHHSPAHDLPYLPTEVWMLVLREATAMSPDPLDISLGLSFLETPCEVEEYHAAMGAKRDLALVSKAWNRYVQEYLYEFVWISRASQAKALALTLLTQFIDGKPSSGQWIRRLHMETPALKRCATDDIRTILDYAPHLVIYSDHHAVRCTRYQEFNDVRWSPEQMVSVLASPNSKLRRLSLTNYSDDPFPYHMSPMLKLTAANLEYLELSSSSIPVVSGHTLARASLVVSLPVLQSLKLTLDNTTFAVLAGWKMPSLRNVSVVSSDFGYAGQGFAYFFAAHGQKLHQLELGHSSSLIVEHNLSLRPRPVQQIPLAEWCPNLKEFICSADAEWNWQSPDWIAPHILLPAHPHLQFIGIRDIDKRLIDDTAAFPSDIEDDAPFFPLVEQISSLLFNEAFPSLRYIRDLSRASHSMRMGLRPEARILKFWAKILARCGDRQVWLEDYRGVNITTRNLKRAGLVTT
ncbi:hypothetical protein HYDPIDRAFT_170141 [Hydnomerulius pinastri MD-312]|uniref:F-box domain-containing protein n=1 Tax=Hydnomerulius pinastri MD-312 TaxID=994086 RepID=A0A0C9WAH4_9AGAM|nr:hypothetical protein HYDPIDRAFT_171251 [Hydnomerulius pinastri MD-312]KIJ60501.1 hypothetical protein HYDPIDRAFT_170141 [Hydnomerulius pinastri MD-312]